MGGVGRRGGSLAYFLLAFVGAVVPYAEVMPWIAQHGLAPRALLLELFATRVGGFFGLDVILSALTLLVFVGRERRAVPLWWLAVPATLLAGVSCGLPLFLGLRERRR